MADSPAVSTGFVGRAKELAALRNLIGGGSHRIALVRGEPGIGKTALLDRLVAESTGRLLRAAGTETESHLPFGTLADLLLPLQEHLAALPGVQREALEICLALRGGHPASPLAIFAGVLGVLEAAAEREPLLVVVDDLQWVDRPTARALVFVARRLRSARATVVLASRPGADAVPEGAEVVTLDLDVLSDPEGRELVAALVRPDSPPVAEQLVAILGGQPLALVEAVRHVPIDVLGGREGVAPTLVPALEATWATVLDELPAATRSAVLVLAAAGSGHRTETTAALHGLGLTRADLQPAEHVDLVRRHDGRLTLRHPLLRRVVLDASPTAAKQAFRALAEHSTGDRRAWYLAAAVDGPDERVAARLVSAAVDASRKGAHEVSAQAWARAAELTAEPAERAERLRAAGVEALGAGELVRARQYAESALLLRDDPVFAADAEVVRSRAVTWLGDPRQAVDDLVAAAERVAPIDRIRAGALYAEATSPAVMAGRVTETLALVRASRLADPPGIRGPRPWRAPEAHALALAGDTVAARAVLDGFDDDARSGVAPALHERAFLGQARMFLESYTDARAALDEAVDEARRHGAVWVLAFALATRAEVDSWRGRWPSARADAEEALRWADEYRLTGTLGYALVVAARLDAVRGDLSGARRRLRRAAEDVVPHGIDCLRTYVPAVEGFVALAGGEPEVAVEHLEEAHRRARSDGLEAPDVVPYGADLVEALVRAGHHERALEVLAWWEERATATGLVHPTASAARCRGSVAADAEEADAWFDRARTAHSGCDVPFERARTLLAHAESRRRWRRPAAARPLLREALSGFAFLGAQPWAARAEAELAAAGGRRLAGDEPVGPTPSWAVLTPQEFQVARAVAEGRTNGEAAASLYVSRKTVENHLTRVYRKLGVRSRTELASRFTEGPDR